MANVIEILINAKNNASAEIDRATGGLGKFATAAGLGAAAGAAAGQVISQAMQRVQEVVIGNTVAMAGYAESLARVGEDTGLTTKQLQVYRREIERNGLSVDALEQSLRLFNQQLAAGTLAKYGIDSRDMTTALQQLAGAYNSALDPARRAEIAGAALGSRNAKLAASVLSVASAYGEKYNAAVTNGYVMSDRLEGSLARLDNSLDDFGDTVQAFKNASAEAFSPLIKGAVDALNAVNRLNQAFERNKARAFASVYSELGGGFQGGSPGDPSGAGRSWESSPRPSPRGGGSPVVDPLVAKLDELVKAFTQAGGGGTLATLRGAMAGGASIGDGSGKSIEDPVTKAFDRVQEAAAQFGTNFAGSLSSTLTQALSITTGSMNLMVQVFTSLANSVVATLADMMARAAAMGLVKLALSFLPTGGASVASKVGGLSLARTPMAGAGNTFVIQSINTRDALDDLMNSTGSLRRANDRMRDISIAAMG